MNVLVSGSTGFIGEPLVRALAARGDTVRRLTRGAADAAEGHVRWNPAVGTIDTARLDGLDAVVHLAGEGIGSGRWTKDKKERIRASRVEGTRLLAGALARLARPPRVLACASALGYYGDRGDQVLTEESPPGAGFLASVCREWEAVASPAAVAGIRVVHLRFGVVLHPSGGALAAMLGPFRAGMGGPIGGGRQYVSWIAREDAIGATLHALDTDALGGPVNVAAPAPVTQAEFAKTLGHVLNRPTLLAVPAFGVRLMFGEMGAETLLASARLAPARLVGTGYRFRWPELAPALRHLLDGAGSG